MKVHQRRLLQRISNYLHYADIFRSPTANFLQPQRSRNNSNIQIEKLPVSQHPTKNSLFWDIPAIRLNDTLFFQIFDDVQPSYFNYLSSLEFRGLQKPHQQNFFAPKSFRKIFSILHSMFSKNPKDDHGKVTYLLWVYWAILVRFWTVLFPCDVEQTGATLFSVKKQTILQKSILPV